LLEESAEDLYENAPCGYISTLPDGVIVKVNRTFLSWTGYEREELLTGKRFQDLLGLGGRVFHETHYAPLLRMQGFANEINFELMCKSGGRSLPVLVNTVEKKDAEGRTLLYRTTLFNISDRKNYERELVQARKKAEEAAKAKADFLSMMSHEIRTPMNAIIGLSNLLQQTGLSPQQQRYLNILHSSSENLLHLLNNILDFSKIEAGKASLEERGFDLRQLISGIFHGLNVKAEEKGLTVHVEIDEQVPACLVGDPVKLGQVLTNLMSNAIKFTERGSVTVAVRVRERLGEMVALDFKVSDTGIGIPQERLSQIFEEFTQASYDINQKYGGTGLGLTISQKLLELHGSRLSVEGVAGAGSSFSFPLRLKVGQEAATSVAPVQAPVDTQSLRGVKLLVAEDNDVNVFVLAQFLRKWGVDFDVVGDGQQALEKIRAASYDLVLMDLQMPRMNGYDATRTVRGLPDERFRRLPILALTASARVGIEERVDLAGFTDFVGKPFKPEELLAKIAQYGVPAEPRPAPVEAPAPSKKQGHDAASGPVRPPPRFSLERFRALAEGDPHALLELTTLAIHNAEKCKQDFKEALKDGDSDAFEFHAHKMKMTLELMQTHGLWAALHQGREFLATEEEQPAARLRAVTHAIHRELDALISALKDEVRQVAASLAIVDEAAQTPVARAARN
jgi:PAS domain S-box-containing protein